MSVDIQKAEKNPDVYDRLCAALATLERTFIMLNLSGPSEIIISDRDFCVLQSMLPPVHFASLRQAGASKMIINGVVIRSADFSPQTDQFANAAAFVRVAHQGRKKKWPMQTRPEDIKS